VTERQKIISGRPKPTRLEPKTRPLLTRPGAAFRCFGDGLCCTDIHALGVLTRSEVKSLRQRDKLSVIYSEAVDGFCLKPIDGRCLFLDGADRCQLHAKHGAEAKPVGCRRFPYGLVATPFGGRITTEHRCPCRTLGARPEISVDDAEMSLRDRAGRLETDNEVPNRVALRAGQRVPFATYVEIESDMIARLNAGERAEDVLAARALPELAEGSWPVVAIEHLEIRDATAGGEMFAWFADALLELSAGHTPPQRPRPWAWAYERASAREGSAEQTADQVYNDWIADEIWMFRWLDWGPFDVARSELATRLKIARLMQSRIEREGVPGAQAAAEAVMICELISEAEEWPKVVGKIATDPSPAEPLSVPVRV
jgi:hypothetical protein